LRYAEADLSSRHDKLTSFFNRGGLDKALQELWQGPFTQVAAIDIDHFKSYNDHYGHLAGDSCLKEMAALIAAETRQPQDILARFGGEEFLVLLSNTDLREGSRIAERMRRFARHSRDAARGSWRLRLYLGEFRRRIGRNKDDEPA
jgi:diguanylate cyclase (GGDEF)-like protein